MQFSRLNAFALVVIVEGLHPFPSRTRKLSPPTPMVLRGKPRGRVGRCQGIFIVQPFEKKYPLRMNPQGVFLYSGRKGLRFIKREGSLASHSPNHPSRMGCIGAPEMRRRRYCLAEGNSLAVWNQFPAGKGDHISIEQDSQDTKDDQGPGQGETDGLTHQGDKGDGAVQEKD